MKYGGLKIESKVREMWVKKRKGGVDSVRDFFLMEVNEKRKEEERNSSIPYFDMIYITLWNALNLGFDNKTVLPFSSYCPLSLSLILKI